MPAEDAEIMAHVWIEVLNELAVPYHYYEELYRRSITLRIRRMSEGLSCDDFTAEMMAACWTGPNGLKAELANRSKQTSEDAVDLCSNVKEHVDGAEKGMVRYIDPFDSTKEILMPCHECRPKAHEGARARHIERSGGKELPPMEVVDKVLKGSPMPVYPKCATPLQILFLARAFAAKHPDLRDRLGEVPEKLNRIVEHLAEQKRAEEKAATV